MLKLYCRHCRQTLLEADRVWEKVGLTGMCPNCSHFYDDAVEREADLLATSPELKAAARRVATVSVLTGLPISVFSGSALLLWAAAGAISLLPIAGILYGLSRVAYGLMYSPRREARSRVSRRTDVRRLAQQQMSTMGPST